MRAIRTRLTAAWATRSFHPMRQLRAYAFYYFTFSISGERVGIA